MMARWFFLGDKPFSHWCGSVDPLTNMVVEGRRGHRGGVLRRRDEGEDAGLADGTKPWRPPFWRIKNLTIVIPS
jgi:hypothetical protein